MGVGVCVGGGTGPIIVLGHVNECFFAYAAYLGISVSEMTYNCSRSRK